MGVDHGNIVASESVEFDVVGPDDDDDDDIACRNQSFCPLFLSNDDEVVELDRSFRFRPPPLFQHSLSSSSSSSCWSTSSSSGLLSFGARGEGEEALFFRERTDGDAGNRKVTPVSSPSKRRRSDNPCLDQIQKKPNSSNKGRKERLGERVAALQQLVSPFGKTDTASVLHEAMGYITFLQEQVQVLSTPYLQPRRRPPGDDEGEEREEEAREGGGGDLRRPEKSGAVLSPGRMLRSRAGELYWCRFLVTFYETLR